MQARKQAEYLDTPISDEALSKLPVPEPALVMEDLPGLLAVNEKVLDSGTMLVTEADTSGICYADLCFDLTHLPVKWLRYLAFYADCLEKCIGSKKQNGFQLPVSSYQISVTTDVLTALNGCAVILKLSGCCLEKDLDVMLSAMQILALQPLRIDTGEILSLAGSKRIERNGVPDYLGNEQAMLMAKAELSEKSFLENILKGLPSLLLLSEISECLADKTEQTISSIASHIVSYAPRILVWSGPDSGYSKTLKWLEKLPANHLLQCTVKPSIPLSSPGMTGFETGNPTSSLGLAINLHSEKNAHLTALGSILNEVFDEVVIKELMLKGGAYAAGSFFSEGILSFYSYRDPAPEKSISVITDSLSNCTHIVRSRISSFDDYILSALKNANPVCHPQRANRTALKNHLSGKTQESVEQLNCSLLNAGIDSLLEFCHTLSRSDIKPGIPL